MIKEIPNHRQYAIDSDTQEVYRIGGCKRPERPLKRSFHKVKGKEFPNGYYYVTLLTRDQEIDGEICDVLNVIPVPLHRLIALTFITKPSPDHIWVNHKDGNKLNNAPDNLEWTTVAQNIQHAFSTGLKIAKKGQESHMYGRKHSLKTKSLMREQKLGRNHPKWKGDYIVFGKRYHSANQAGIALNLPPKTIEHRANNPKIKDYSFIPKSVIEEAYRFVEHVSNT
jgi:hypothetical protein